MCSGKIGHDGWNAHAPLRGASGSASLTAAVSGPSADRLARITAIPSRKGRKKGGAEASLRSRQAEPRRIRQDQLAFPDGHAVVTVVADQEVAVQIRVIHER